MREYQHPAPLTTTLTLGLASAEVARAALETVREYRYNPHQPRDAAGRWTSGDSHAAADTARHAAGRHEETHPDSRTPEPPSDNHAPDPAHSARSGLKGHLHLVAAHAAYAAGNHAAAAHHLARAEHHLGQASAEHGVKGRVKTDMEGLKGALKANKHSADLPGLRVYAYNPNQPRDHTGKWTGGNATAAQHEEGASHHAARRVEAKEAGNLVAASRHHAAQLIHELAAAHKGGLDTTEHIGRVAKALDALHVQARTAFKRKDNTPEAEADKKAAHDHFNEQFKATKKAIKGKGDFPALSHYRAAGSKTPSTHSAVGAPQGDELVKSHIAAGHEALKADNATLADKHYEAAKAVAGPEHQADLDHLSHSVLSHWLGEAPPEKPIKAKSSQSGKTPAVDKGKNPHIKYHEAKAGNATSSPQMKEMHAMLAKTHAALTAGDHKAAKTLMAKVMKHYDKTLYVAGGKLKASVDAIQHKLTS